MVPAGFFAHFSSCWEKWVAEGCPRARRREIIPSGGRKGRPYGWRIRISTQKKKRHSRFFCYWSPAADSMPSTQAGSVSKGWVP